MTTSSESSYDASRREMVQTQLLPRGIDAPRVLDVIGKIPREQFVPPNSMKQAYQDYAMSIEHGQTISQPYIVALMTQLLAIQPDHKILEIGTGSGYQTAILANLARHVYTIERIAELSANAQKRLFQLKINNVTFHIADGSLGWPKHSPYDRIIVTAAAPSIPKPFTEQLADKGKLIIPIGSPDVQTMTVIEKQNQQLTEYHSIPCRFVKLLGNGGWNQT